MKFLFCLQGKMRMSTNKAGGRFNPMGQGSSQGFGSGPFGRGYEEQGAWGMEQQEDFSAATPSFMDAGAAYGAAPTGMMGGRPFRGRGGRGTAGVRGRGGAYSGMGGAYSGMGGASGGRGRGGRGRGRGMNTWSQNSAEQVDQEYAEMEKWVGAF